MHLCSLIFPYGECNLPRVCLSAKLVSILCRMHGSCSDAHCPTRTKETVSKLLDVTSPYLVMVTSSLGGRKICTIWYNQCYITLSYKCDISLRLFFLRNTVFSFLTQRPSDCRLIQASSLVHINCAISMKFWIIALNFFLQIFAASTFFLRCNFFVTSIIRNIFGDVHCVDS